MIIKFLAKTTNPVPFSRALLLQSASSSLAIRLCHVGGDGAALHPPPFAMKTYPSHLPHTNVAGHLFITLACSPPPPAPTSASPGIFYCCTYPSIDVQCPSKNFASKKIKNHLSFKSTYRLLQNAHIPISYYNIVILMHRYSIHCLHV